MRIRFALATTFLASCLICQAAPISFPTGYIPFDFVDYVTSQNGYSLIVGETTRSGGLMELVEYLRSLPAVSGNQQYTDQSIELAPGQFFSHVLVPTSAEREGNFQDFGRIIDPMASMPFPGSIIPMARFGELFAFRVGPADPASTAPEPGAFLLVALGMAAVVTTRLRPGRRS